MCVFVLYPEEANMWRLCHHHHIVVCESTHKALTQFMSERWRKRVNNTIKVWWWKNKGWERSRNVSHWFSFKNFPARQEVSKPSSSPLLLPLPHSPFPLITSHNRHKSFLLPIFFLSLFPFMNAWHKLHPKIGIRIIEVLCGKSEKITKQTYHIFPFFFIKIFSFIKFKFLFTNFFFLIEILHISFLRHKFISFSLVLFSDEREKDWERKMR